MRREEKRRQQARAQHEKDIAIMSANKRVAIANAKLRAIQESLAEEERYESPDFPDMDTTECLERTIAWVRSNSPILEDNPHFRPIHTSKDGDPPVEGNAHEKGYAPTNILETGVDRADRTNMKREVRFDPSVTENTPSLRVAHSPGDESTPEDNLHKSSHPTHSGHTHEMGYAQTDTEVSPRGTKRETGLQKELTHAQHTLSNFRPPATSTPLVPPRLTATQEIPSSTLLETFTTSNRQLVASLARQSLPKCLPDVFKGDVAMFHSWKRSFKVVVRDADITPDQELNYLRSFTSGDPQELVDNYRKRQGDNPTTTLGNLWRELERRFGNTAALTQALIERLCSAAHFGEKDNVKLQKLADLCADIDCQMTHLPGLACLNFPVTIRPIVERLPGFLQSKWEKEIVRYASDYNDAYPTFHKFSMMIQDQARKRNHPNISAGVSMPTTVSKTGRVDPRRQ